LLREVAGSLPIETHPPLPALRAPAFELRRLLCHLLADRPAHVALSSDTEEVRLTVTPGMPASPDTLDRVLRWQAVQSLARLTGGAVRQEATRTTIAWPLREG